VPSRNARHNARIRVRFNSAVGTHATPLARAEGLARRSGVHQVARGRLDEQHRQRVLRGVSVPSEHLEERRRVGVSASGVPARADLQSVVALAPVGTLMVAVGNCRGLSSQVSA